MKSLLLRVSLCAIAAGLLPHVQAWAQFATVINTPPTMIGDQYSIGSNTQLNVLTGGSVGAYFHAGAVDGTSSNVEVNISGGTVGSQFTAYSGSTINVTAGTVGFIDAGVFPEQNTNINVNISGGNVGVVNANYGSIVNVSGGLVGELFANDLANISGGQVARLHVTVVSEANISGGRVNQVECLQDSVLNNPQARLTSVT